MFLAPTNSYAAQCKGNVIIQPNAMLASFYDTITITTTEDCFSTGAKYWLIAYPKKPEFPSGLDFGASTMPPAVADIIPQNSKTITTVFKLAGTLTHRGLHLIRRVPISPSKNIGPWEVAVCKPELDYKQDGDYTPCTDKNKHLVTTDITVDPVPTATPLPTPTLVPDRPVIDKTGQSHCAYQSGEKAYVWKIVIKPNIQYRWWWDGKKTLHSVDSVTDPSRVDMMVTVPEGETTNQSGEKRFCIDTQKRALDYVNGVGDGYCQENGIRLFFTAAPPKYPDDDKKCDAAPPPSTTVCAPGEQSDRFTSECIRPDTGSPCLGTEGVIEFLKCKDDGTGYEHVSYSCSIYAPKCTSGCKYAVGQECTLCAIQTTYSCNDVATASATSCFTSIYCGNFSSTIAPTSIITPPPCKKWVDVNGKEIATSSALVAEGHAKCAAFDTAFGDIATDQTGLIRKIFTVILSLSGGIALVLIIYSGYQLVVSRANPEKIQGAKETITSAIVGLLFIIFSIAILQIIGVEILRIPGFSP